MKLLTIGLNHKTASVELREKLSFTSAGLCAFLERLDTAALVAPQLANSAHTLYETVILSTCNRLEFYVLTLHPQNAIEEIIALMSQTFHVAADDFRANLFHLEGEAAVSHLMRVAAGLDSLVLGESQILGQVVAAYRTASAHNTVGPILSRLFEMSIHAGKRARTETGIGVNPASVSSVAVKLARRHLRNLADKTVMLLGAGKMSELALRSLLEYGIKELLIVNRTRSRAEEMAAQWNAAALTFDDLPAGLAKADLLIASTAAPHTVLHREQLAPVMAARPERPLLIVDIALPRDVEDEVADLPNVRLYNLDHLQSQAADNLKTRQAEIPRVETILAEETAAFVNWRRALDVKPTIIGLRRQFEQVRQQELTRALNRLPELDERQAKIVAELSHRLMNKFLHRPTTRLRAEAARGNGIEYTMALQDLFALEGSK